MSSSTTSLVSTELQSRIIGAARTAAGRATGRAVADALASIDPADLVAFFHAGLDAGSADPAAQGLGASPGAACGRIVLSAAEAVAAAEAGDAVILVRSETSPDDVLGMQAANGILTVRGGLSSHAAVVARGWGIPAVVGAADVTISGDPDDPEAVTIGDTRLRAGDEITIDGSTGHIYPGVLAVSATEAPPELDTLLAWADAIAAGHVEVRANADSAAEAAQARTLGAQGIGLCRTEHMFLSPQRLPVVRRFILTDDPATEAEALTELEEAQTHDFQWLLEAMDGLPVTVRLLDPPLHEFLPDLTDLSVRDALGELSDFERTELTAARRLHETNPMIGTRGVRLGILRTGLYDMQVRALCRAAANLIEHGRRPHVEIMIPLVADAEELRRARARVRAVLDEIGHPELSASTVTVGAMIETPRAALTAAALAHHADFFSFGTNDLTQLTFGFSRDDVESNLLPVYLDRGILAESPFVALDHDGVGELVRIACEQARANRPGIKLGVCGEHAGHPASTGHLVRLGVDSVSCAPLRIPMTRLAVAQALLDCGRVDVDDVEFDYRLGPPAESDRDESPVTDTTVAESTRSEETQTVDDGRAALEIDEALVLHVLRVRGFLTPDAFEASLGAHPADVLAALVDAGHVKHVEASDMYSLTPSGREHQTTLMADDATDALSKSLAPHYEPFLELNTEFKELCTMWQLRNGEPNDHSDAGYDRDCVGKLIDLNRRVRPVIESMAGSLPRLARYLDRLDTAAANVDGGEIKQFTGVMCESYHDIWMELHEDLIVLQRIDRISEGSF